MIVESPFFDIFGDFFKVRRAMKHKVQQRKRST